MIKHILFINNKFKNKEIELDRYKLFRYSLKGYDIYDEFDEKMIFEEEILEN